MNNTENRVYGKNRLMLLRTITLEECPWLERPMLQNAIVYRFQGCDYGCVSQKGLAVTLDKGGGYPFFELPKNSVAAF